MAKRTTRSRSSDTSATTDLTEPINQANDTRSNSMGSEPSEEDIRLRAYHRFLARGGQDGGDFDDWMQAKEELKRIRN